MTTLSFEKALTELESIVEKLEKGGLSLNESLAFFEKGVKLARFLRQELEKAEKKVEILLKDDKGQARKESYRPGEEKAAFPEEEKENQASPEDEEIPF